MKIGPNLDALGNAGNAGAATGAPAARVDSPATTRSAAQAPVSASHVQLSSLSTQLGGTDALAAASGPYDARKVQDIKAAISEGRFKVNAAAVADQLIASVQSMLTGAGGRS